jgi:outer membrane lipoprotein-sorting protein
MTKPCRFLAAALFAAVLVARAAAGPDAVIARARAYLGPEAVLEAITSIHYVGTLAGEETVKDQDGKQIRRPFNGTIDIIFQKPYRQRVVLVSYKGTEITVLDDYEAWYYKEDATDANRKKFMLLGKDQVKNQRANTWENLAFFRGIERRGGQVEDLGSSVIDGRTCEKIAFVHEPGIKFYRYFDRATGQLMLTELGNGDLFREKGEMRVDGVRFPKMLVNTSKDQATGRENTLVIKLDKITLNEVFPESLFAVPMFTGK